METRTPQRRFFDAALSLAHVLVKPLLVLVLLIFTKGVLAVPFIAGTIMSDADVVRRLAAYGILDQLGGRKVPPLVVKTANYTVKAPDTAANAGDASGTIFQNTGAGGAVTFTLFAPALKYVGVYYEFFGMVDQNLVVNCSGAVGVSVANATVTTVTCSTASQKIGAHIKATCDGTKWILNCDSVGVTYTLA